MRKIIIGILICGLLLTNASIILGNTVHNKNLIQNEDPNNYVKTFDNLIDKAVCDVTIMGDLLNNPPNKPNRPSGPTKGKEGRSYQYYSVASDPDGDELSYLFDWGDGTNSGWTTPLFSGQTVIISHTWDHKGTFNIRVKAKDKYNFESEWSESLSVSMPKIRNKLHMLFFEILNRLFERFPFLEKIVKSLQCLNDIFSTIFNQFGGEA